jgi:hypothetical protein
MFLRIDRFGGIARNAPFLGHRWFDRRVSRQPLLYSVVGCWGACAFCGDADCRYSGALHRLDLWCSDADFSDQFCSGVALGPGASLRYYSIFEVIHYV